VRVDWGIQDRGRCWRGLAGLAWRAIARRLEYREAMVTRLGDECFLKTTIKYVSSSIRTLKVR